MHMMTSVKKSQIGRTPASERATLFVGQEHGRLFRAMASLERRDITELARLMLDARAQAAGLSPVAPSLPAPQLGEEARARVKEILESDEGNDRLNLSLGSDYIELLAQMAKLERRNKSALVRLMIDERAQAMGLEPAEVVL